MLRSWLGPTSMPAFCGQYLQQQPIAHPTTATSAASVMSWEVLDRILAGDGDRAADVLVVAGGRLLDAPPPRSLTELRAYMRVGIGLCLRHTERCDPGLRGVADTFEHELGSAQVQLFVTPGGTHGFGWHFDDEDVFIAHTIGRKDYYFRPNTVTDAQAHASVFATYERERSPMGAATLVAGDFLYIPARWWHMAICHEDSLSVSVGVRPRIPLPRPTT